VFVETEEDLRGQVRKVQITWSGPWSMQAALKAGATPVEPLEVSSLNLNIVS
jgi:hypothetical protein